MTQTPAGSANGRRREHPWFARFYPRISEAMDRAGMAQYRARLLDGLRGEVVEIGAGNGLNFRHYPREVTRLVAVEPEPTMRMLTRQAAQEASPPQAGPGPHIEVVGGVAERLPLADASCDAVVVSLVLCSVPDQKAAFAEIQRVLRPGGEFRFLEHVRSQGHVAAFGQRTLDALGWPTFGAGCHCSRATGDAVAAAGFEISTLDRFRFPARQLLPQPASPHVLGMARKAA